MGLCTGGGVDEDGNGYGSDGKSSGGDRDGGEGRLSSVPN